MLNEAIFTDRFDAGRKLAQQLGDFAGREDVIVLALPRGGVPVAFEVAEALGVPMDVFVVRKLGVPGQEELAFGALASGDVTVFNESILRLLDMPGEMLDEVIAHEQVELARRERLYRADLPPLNISGMTVIIVDDGLATGASMAAAVAALKKLGPKDIVVAVPVSSTQACEELDRQTGIRCIAAYTPEPFHGVGMWYQDFSQTSDEEVQELLAKTHDALVHA
jgi:predicted phosphoribosyltransferase